MHSYTLRAVTTLVLQWTGLLAMLAQVRGLYRWLRMGSRRQMQ